MRDQQACIRHSIRLSILDDNLSVPSGLKPELGLENTIWPPFPLGHTATAELRQPRLNYLFQ